MATDAASGDRSMPQSPAALERAIDERREHLAATIDELAIRAQPKEIARRGAAGARARAAAVVRTDEGQVRVERIAAVTGALAVIVAVLVWLRRRR